MSDTLGTVILDALRMRDRLKADGLTGPALNAALETLLRDVWPKPTDRTDPWHDLCAQCRDYGLEMHACPGDATCGRRRRHPEHEYGRPCFCPAGRRHQEKRAPSPEDATTLAAKPKKPMSRWGAR